MRLVLAAATIGACLAASHLIAWDQHPPAAAIAIEGESRAGERPPLQSGKQVRGKPGAGGGDDSCQWANDNECDDPDIGTGACTMGTDVSDCRAMREGENDSCRWANDRECDEPRLGTGACVQGTDRTDCGTIAWMRNQTDNCATSYNGVCEEPGQGNGRCAARSDRSDCHGRERPLTINDHFFGRDDRVRINVQERPWRFMGRFVNDGGEACTATLIARDVIVTAAHCIHRQDNVAGGGEFSPAAGGSPARALAYIINPRFNYTRFSTTDEIDSLDWALIRLDQPLGDRLGFGGVRNITGQGRAIAIAASLYQAGYSWDTGEILSANIGCHMVNPFPDGTFAHECDTTRGDSGSAFLVRDGDSFDVIGVDSSFRENPDGPLMNIAVSAASFQGYIADFVTGRSGTRFGAGAAAKPKS